jgi:transketolase N-terminal domain/subunit
MPRILTDRERNERDGERIANILEALKTPMTHKELGQATSFVNLNRLVADLRTGGLIRTNPLTKKLELCGWTIFSNGQ